MINSSINEEIIHRIEEKEAAGYDPGPRLNRTDYIGIAIVFAVSVLGIIIGYGA